MLTTAEPLTLLVGLGVLLATARLLGGAAMALRQPAVVGELLAGVLLGPTVLGAALPKVAGALFPAAGDSAAALRGISQVAVVAFLLVAGLQIDLVTVRRSARAALSVSTFGMIVPFVLGFGAAFVIPALALEGPAGDRRIFALFLGTALSISALPVIARTLMDLGLQRSSLGTVVITASALVDLVGWNVFGAVLAFAGREGPRSPLTVAALTAAFVILSFTALRLLARWALPRLEGRQRGPSGALGFVFAVVLLCAAATEAIGIHSAFGAFIAGVVLANSGAPLGAARRVLGEFTGAILVPLFFAGVGLQVDFASGFDAPLVLALIAIGSVGKIAGGTGGARLAGMPWREAWAVGFGMNSRGAMEIVLGVVALDAGLISEPVFVAILALALFTSMTSGPLMRWILAEPRPIGALDSTAPSDSTCA